MDMKKRSAREDDLYSSTNYLIRFICKNGLTSLLLFTILLMLLNCGALISNMSAFATSLNSYGKNNSNFASTVNVQLLTYRNTRDGYEIHYPSDWTAQEGILAGPINILSPECCADVTIFFTSPENYQKLFAAEVAAAQPLAGQILNKTSTFLSKAIKTYGINLNTDELGHTFNDSYSSNPSFYGNLSYINPSESGTAIAGYPAYKIGFDTNLGGDSFRSMEVGTIIDGKMCVMAYRTSSDTYERFLPTFQMIVDSFQTTNNG